MTNEKTPLNVRSEKLLMYITYTTSSQANDKTPIDKSLLTVDKIENGNSNLFHAFTDFLYVKKGDLNWIRYEIRASVKKQTIEKL